MHFTEGNTFISVPAEEVQNFECCVVASSARLVAETDIFVFFDAQVKEKQIVAKLIEILTRK